MVEAKLQATRIINLDELIEGDFVRGVDGDLMVCGGWVPYSGVLSIFHASKTKSHPGDYPIFYEEEVGKMIMRADREVRIEEDGSVVIPNGYESSFATKQEESWARTLLSKFNRVKA